jgi:aspartate/glutamate racemase
VTRVALIHALVHSVVPINEALERDWPQCRRMNLLDDSLSADLAASPRGLDDAMHTRFIALADYAVGTGADAILFTCSAFGPCIDAVARRHADRPVLKPNEAMIEDAVASGKRIGLVASFAPTLSSMPAEFPADCALDSELTEEALAALSRGDLPGHDRCIADAAQKLAERGAGVIALAQFSMARARTAVAARCGLPVLTTVDSAMRALRRRLNA